MRSVGPPRASVTLKVKVKSLFKGPGGGPAHSPWQPQSPQLLLGCSSAAPPRLRVSEATETTPLASRSKAAGRWSKLCSPLLSTDQPVHELVLRQLSKEAMAAWSGDPDGVPDYLGATLRSLQSILGTDTFGLVEETVPQSSFRPNYSLVSRGSQDRELERLAQAVIVPLKSGLQSFNDVSEILLRVCADVVLPDSQTFHDIRRQITHMKQQMESSECIAAGELAELDRQTELLTAEQGQLAREKQERELELDHLQKQLESDKSTLENYEGVLSARKRNLESAEETLRSMEEKREKAEVQRNVGIGVSFIPIVGWFVGPALAVTGAVDMDQASKAVETAKREVGNWEAELRSYSNKVSEYQWKISDTKGKIKEADDKIHGVAAELQALSGRREAVTELQAKMREVVHHLGALSGVGSVAELHTRRLVLLEPVMKVMEEMTAALGRITGDQLLNSAGIRSLTECMRTNQHRLQQLADGEQG